MSRILNENTSNELHRTLCDLLVLSEADDCLLCDTGGYVLAREGDGDHDPYQMAALGAGVYGASRELARLLGEREFNVVLHQGAQKSIFICAVHADALLVIVFSQNASAGLVKLYAKPAAVAVRALLEDARRLAMEAEDLAGHPLVLNRAGPLFRAGP